MKTSMKLHEDPPTYILVPLLFHVPSLSPGTSLACVFCPTDSALTDQSLLQRWRTTTGPDRTAVSTRALRLALLASPPNHMLMVCSSFSAPLLNLRCGPDNAGGAAVGQPVGDIARTTAAGVPVGLSGESGGGAAGILSEPMAGGVSGTTDAIPAAVERLPFYRKRWFIVFLIVVGLVGIGLLFVILYPVIRAIAQHVVDVSGQSCCHFRPARK